MDNRNMRFDRRGFTLIELIIVGIIVGVLAAIAVTMMQDMKAKAICAEAIAGLSALRVSIQQYYVEHNTYYGEDKNISDLSAADLSKFFPGLKLRANSNYGESDLDGTYF